MSQSHSTPKFFSAYEQEDGSIIGQNSHGKRWQAGVTVEFYNDLKQQYDQAYAAATEYRETLLELGKEHGKQYIKVPIDPEDLMKQQAELIAEQREQLRDQQKQFSKVIQVVSDLSSKIENLTKDKSHEPSRNESAEHVGGSKKSPKGSN